MRGVLTEEQEQLGAAVNALFADKSPEAAVRKSMESAEGYDRELWDQMAEQMGLFGLAIPEQFGGDGYGSEEIGVVMTEMGRALYCGPYLSSVVMFATALGAAGDNDAAARYLPAIASGATIGTVALTEDKESWEPEGVTLSARADGSGYTLHGTKTHVLDGHIADVILVVGRTDSGISLFLVDAADPAVTRTPLPTLDRTRRQATLTFDGARGRLVGIDGEGWAAVARMLDVAVIALANEQVGGIERVLDMSVQYAKERTQFGRPIGSFQAVKHKCADMLVALESAKSTARLAASADADGDPGVSALADLSKSVCSEAYSRCASETIQLHGGIGFTWEHPAHLYFKRARSSEVLFGGPSHHRRLLGERVGLLPAR
ncbi:alkylation response protein AidB-like acyl-CoA dehydrogenase [Williamsia limnetica]|uniref:Alkylation response protein AidB-like acyl-CoA dehydrogenase n=1 Tax=Williamsia limnetica TaxID=882452 RepID=A0A318S179_WILLI|nr:acyl-CoA dehydrogenase family protein [Williamsia limnetica]PYE16935.1 alkylation response protein AidB-like acyl-CoA dehydrogenase [Williamsia limnetica]